jgi:GntR family transcriptional regulator, rspAB operon transcriptional repressor
MTDSGKGDLENLRVDSLRDLVYSQIKKMILANRMWPGQQIVIDQLVKQLGVSHTPVREALSILAADGLVTIERYKNARIATITANDVKEVYEMRVLLEGWAVTEAAVKLSGEQLTRLANRLEKVRQEVTASNFDDFLEADLFLHNTITGCVDNRFFTRILDLISNQSARIRSLVEATHPIETMHQILNEHCEILEAMRSHDPERARQLMEKHLRSARERTLIALQNIPV